MTATSAILAFSQVEANYHWKYNEWHQLDHRPEYLALPGVIWGERWVRSPDCAPFSSGTDAALLGCQYVNTYWYREPIDNTLAAFRRLTDLTYQWGRRPELRYVHRPLAQRFIPIKGYVNPRVSISTDALPLRPNRGIHIRVSDWSGDSVELEESFRWIDREYIPRLLLCPGVAGVWTLVNEATRGQGEQEVPPCRRLTILFLDEDPLEVSKALPTLDNPTAAVENVRFVSPLRSITPWDWNWFDQFD